MMKRILLMRHAKSSWDHPGIVDRDRPLNDRGRRAAAEMASWLPNQNRMPDHILFSPSKRTTETVDLVHGLWKSVGRNIPLQQMESLYLAPPQSILEAIGQTPETAKTTMLVAHNPGLEELVSFIDRQYHRFPTAAVADIVLETDRWDLALTDARQFLKACRLESVWRPKEIFESAQRDAS